MEWARNPRSRRTHTRTHTETHRHRLFRAGHEGQARQRGMRLERTRNGPASQTRPRAAHLDASVEGEWKKGKSEGSPQTTKPTGPLAGAPASGRSAGAGRSTKKHRKACTTPHTTCHQLNLPPLSPALTAVLPSEGPVWANHPRY